MATVASYDKLAFLFPFASNLDSLAPRGWNVPTGDVSVSSDANSVYGSSASFDGTGDYILLPTIDLGSQDFEFFVRLSTTSSTSYACIIGKDDGNFGSGAWGLLFNTGSANGYVQLWVADYSSGSPLLSLTSVSIRDGSTHEIVVSRSGSSWKLIVDGTNVASATWSGTISVDARKPMTLGRQWGYSRDFSGRMYDAALWIGAAIRTASYTVDSTALTSLISNSGTTSIKDSSGNNAARILQATPRLAANRSFTTTSASDGTYSLRVPNLSEGYNVTILDDAAGTAYDDILVRNVGRS